MKYCVKFYVKTETFALKMCELSCEKRVKRVTFVTYSSYALYMLQLYVHVKYACETSVECCENHMNVVGN